MNTTYFVKTNKIGKYIQDDYLFLDASLNDLQVLNDLLGHYNDLQLSWIPTRGIPISKIVLFKDKVLEKNQFTDIDEFVKKVKYELTFDKGISDSEEMIALKTLLLENDLSFTTKGNDHIYCTFWLDKKTRFDFYIKYENNHFNIEIYKDLAFVKFGNVYTVQKATKNDLSLGYVFDTYKFDKAPSTVNLDELEVSVFPNDDNWKYGQLNPKNILLVLKSFDKKLNFINEKIEKDVRLQRNDN